MFESIVFLEHILELLFERKTRNLCGCLGVPTFLRHNTHRKKMGLYSSASQLLTLTLKQINMTN